MSDKTEAERRALPWYDPEAIPRAESDATHCRHPDCHDTNWGGRDRIHTRGEDCPPLPTSAPQPAADTETEVQWGVRYENGVEVEMDSREGALDEIGRTPGASLIHCFVTPATYTSWEEA